MTPATTLGNWFSPFSYPRAVACLTKDRDALLIFRPIFLVEDGDRRVGRDPGRRAVDLTQVILHRGLDGFGHLVEHVGGLVNPAALMPCAGVNLLDGLPEAERAVPDRQFGRDGQAVAFHLDEQFAPALGALPDADLEADQLLPARGCGSDQHQHAFRLVLHPSLQIDAIGPHVDISPCRQVPRLPARILGLPFGRKTADDRGRQVRGVFTQQGRQRLLEIAGRDAAQIQRGQ